MIYILLLFPKYSYNAKEAITAEHVSSAYYFAIVILDLLGKKNLL